MQREPVPPHPVPNGSLGEFLGTVRLRNHAWCMIHLSEKTGFHLSRNDRMTFYAVLEGDARVTTSVGQVRVMGAGDIVFILPGEVHKVRNHNSRTTPLLDLPSGESDAQDIPVVKVGTGPVVTRLLHGSVEPIWPNGLYPSRAPTILAARPASLGIDIAAMLNHAKGEACMALLARIAVLLFAAAFRDNPRCRAAFRWNLSDPIVRAKVLIEKHPFRPWTVSSLASEVRMGRSNFASRFISRMGQTPIETLTEERMHHAAQWLLHTALSIAEIGERAGYRSETAFIRRFTKLQGMTPSRWRREHGWPSAVRQQDESEI